MTMDFSQLHTYTPPQCAPENTGYTYSLSSSYSTAALEFEQEHQIAPVYDSPRMSRRSLRLQTDSGHYGNEILVDYSQNRSSSSSSHTSTRRTTRTVRSRKQQQQHQHQSSSNTLSLSLNQVSTPRTTLSFSAVSTPVNSSSVIQESNMASIDSLHSSILDSSHQRRRAVTTATTTTTTTSMFVDGNWEKSCSADLGSSNVNGERSRASESQVALANGYICRDCSLHAHQAAHSLSTSTCQDTETSVDAGASSPSSATSIYSMDKSRRSRTGFLTSACSTCVCYSKRAARPVVSFITLMFNSLLWLSSRARSLSGTGVLVSSLSSMRRAAASSLWLLKQTTLHRVRGHRMRGHREDGHEGPAHSSYCGSINVKDLLTEDSSNLNLNGSLCDDCKGKQFSETQTVLLKHSSISRRRRVAGAMWTVLAYAGYCLLLPVHGVMRAGRALGSGVATAAQTLLSMFWVLLAAPEMAVRRLLWFLAAGWYQLVSLMCLLNVFFLTRVLPVLWKLLLLLLPLLLLLAFWWFGPSTSALLAHLPLINWTEWRPVSPLTLLSAMIPASAPGPRETESPSLQTPATPVSHPLVPPPSPPAAAVVSTLDLERWEQMERQLALLWTQVRDGEQKQEQHHGDVLLLYKDLKEQLHLLTDRKSLGLWVSSMMEQRISVLQGALQQDSEAHAKNTEQQKLQQEILAERLADVQLLLSALAAKTQEVQQKQQEMEMEKKEEMIPAAAEEPTLLSVKQEDHDALLAEVQRLKLQLGQIEQGLQGVLGCKGKCEQLDVLHETISAQVSSQVRQELQQLFFGSSRGQGSAEEQLPESLLLWLSQRYTTTPDLRASLAELEQRILNNVSLQLELSRAQTLGEAQTQAQSLVHTVTGSVQHSISAEGMNEEQVKLIVHNALKLYSQDRTGQVDYALESGGGSILSTRCSETYETKTALMSLFGLPLWYFSQSPRVVIQPDVYPGNCWAFKGTQGYLVIRLSMSVRPTSFCLEHIPRALSPTGNITSAPQNFTVFGLDNEHQEEGTLLGRYVYQEDGDSLQSFPVTEQNDKSFQIMEVRVLSNWGHPDYTCLYRFRVHGEARPQ